MECLYHGDPRVCVLLGKQSLPEAGESIRRSRFVYSMYLEGRYLLFHTLTRQLLALQPRAIDFFSDDRLFPASILEDGLPAKLYEDFFLVPEHTDESRTYLELKDILILKEELPQFITQYVILPTTTCNARCFYCFEQGMRYRRTSERTLQDTLRFILQHRPAGDRTIHIHWFGGEPLCAADHIDRICTRLTESGVGYTAEMTSNGSLFTEALVRKAAEIWKVGKIQITLDGMSEEYARRKRYTRGVKHPFDTVIRNIHLLIAAGISLSLRLNVDLDNLGEIFRLVDFLAEEFPGDERKKLTVYAHSLFGKPGEGTEACPVSAANDAVEARVLGINDYIRRQRLRPYDLGPLLNFKTHYCMVTAPECNVLIDSAGQLFACDSMTANMRYGDVKTGIDPEAWNRVAAPCAIREECAKCVFLPQCTEFDRCPTRAAYDDCFRQEKRLMEDNLRAADIFFREMKQQKQREGNPVPD